MTTKEALIEKLKAGGQITLEDIESLGRRKIKDSDTRPAKVCSPKHSVAKAKKGTKLNRWELEDLAKSPEHAVEYAKLTGARFPECEETLLEKNNRRLIVEYFLDLLEEPNKSFENWLLKNGHELIKRYCADVRKSRWEEGEEALFKVNHRWGGGMDASHALEYQKEFAIGPWDNLERLVLNGKHKVSDRRDAVEQYLKNCGPGRHETTERRLLKFGNTAAIFVYARFCVCGRLPDELHNKMILSGKKSAKKYLAWLSAKKKNTLAYLRSLGEGERGELLSAFPETSEPTM